MSAVAGQLLTRARPCVASRMRSLGEISVVNAAIVSHTLSHKHRSGFQLLRLQSRLGSSSRALSPSSLYSDRVERGILYNDNFQRRVAASFDRLHNAIVKKPVVTAAANLPLRNFISEKVSAWFNKRADETIPRDDQQGIYLFGDVGTGKTMVMDLFYDSLPPNVSKRRTHFHSFMLDVHARLHRYKQENPGTPDPLKKVAEQLATGVRVLCFDEFQVTDIADAMILRKLLEVMFAKGVIIAFTSNRHPEELYQNGIQRRSFIPAIELLEKKCNVIDLNSGLDYRKKQRTSLELYLNPLTHSNRQKLDRLYQLLTDGQISQPFKIDFWGRSLRVEDHVNGVGKFSFQTLCSRPLSANDYLHLVDHLNIIILSDVPILNHNLRPEARRFITLLDAVYEKKLTLLMNADAEPAGLFFPNLVNDDPDERHLGDLGDLDIEDLAASSLFSGEEEIFAAQRAVSRLTEMKSKTWVHPSIINKLSGRV